MTEPVHNTTIIMSQPGAPQKSMGVAILLAIAFGPIGLLYASVTGGVIMFVVSIIVLPLTLFLGIFLTWPACVIWAAIAVNKHREQQALLASQTPQSSTIVTGAAANRPVNVIDQKPKEPIPPSQ